MKPVLEYISNQTNINFLAYKKSTLKRRLEKRLNALEIQNYDDYLSYLKANPEEVDNAFSTMLLGISEFFRDSEVFNAINQYLAKIVTEKNSTDPLRIWSIGCSRGEEPFSLAILLADLLGNLDKYNVKIFASDISEDAIQYGRRGIYPEKTLQKLTTSQIDNYFDPLENGQYQLKESLRKHVIFCNHDVTQDPPFLNIDLITCRNLLIYFDSNLQNQVIPVFSYSITQNGYLAIGKSENIDEFADYLELLNAKEKIYTNKLPITSKSLRFFNLRTFKTIEAEAPTREDNPKPSIKELARDTIANTYEHPYVVINEQNQIIETYGELRLFMRIGNGGADNVLEMINPELKHELHTALIKSYDTHLPQVTGQVNFTIFEKDYSVKMEVRPVISQEELTQYSLLIFKSIATSETETLETDTDEGTENDKDHLIRTLKQELQVSQEQLETYKKQLEESEVESQSLTEELQSANEELKSANEELETSNEELQSLNEELNSKNQELREVNEALETSRKDLEERENQFRLITENITDIVSIQDREGIIQYISPSVKDVLGHDQEELIGTSANSLIHKDDLPKIQEEAYPYFENGQASKHEYRLRLKNGDYKWVETKTKPIFDENNNLVKVQNATRDICERKVTEERLKSSESRFRKLVETSPVAILIHVNFEIVFLNQKAIEILGGNEQKDFLGKSVMDIVNPEHQPLIKKRIKKIYSNQESDVPTIASKFKKLDGTSIDVEVGASYILYKGQPASQAVFQDFTEKLKAEHAIWENKEKLKAIIENTEDHIWLTNANYEIEEFNEAFAKSMYEEKGLIIEKGLNLVKALNAINPDFANMIKSKIDKAFKGKQLTFDNNFIPNTEKIYQVSFFPVMNDKGVVSRVSVFAKNVTDQKNYERALRENEERHDLALSAAGLGTWDWLINQSQLIWDNRNYHLYGLTNDNFNKYTSNLERFRELLHPADYEDVLAQLEKAENGEQEFEKIFCIIDPEGNVRYIQSASKTFFDEYDKPYRILGINWEITQQRKAEEELRLRDRAIENAGEGILTASSEEDNPIVFVNRKFCELTGYTSDEVEGYNWRFLLGRDTDPEVINHIEECIQGAQEFRGELINYKKDGTPFWNYFIMSPVLNEEGKVTHFVGFLTDISDRKKDEEKIKLLSRFPEDNPNPVIRVSGEGEILYTNEAGKPFIENWERTINQSIPDEFKTEIKRSLTDNKSISFESQIGRKNYTIRINPNKEENYLFLYAIDITEQKTVEQELRRQEELLDSINQHINEGIFRSTPENGVIYVNEPFARMFGYQSAEEVIETQGLELYANPQERDQLLKDVQEEESFQNKEVLFKRKDGSTFWGLLSSKLLEDENGQIFFDGAIRDITEQKDVENQLIEAKEQAEEMSRLKTNFLANMSHEIRTPINGIMGLVQVMEEEYGQIEGLNEYNRMIKESTERLLNTITSILDFSKLEAKDVNLNLASIEINDRINQLIPHLVVLADKKGIALNTNLASENLNVQIDKQVFDQIINNLVGNAIKFTNEGSVTVKTNIKSQRKEKMEIEVIDTGIGISQENIEKIFSPFEQESQGHGRDYEGTGLGLSIVKKYVELFGGSIKIDSEKNVGSSFKVTLPLKNTLSKQD